MLRRVLIAAGVAVVAVAAAVAFVLLHAPGNVSHPDLQFTSPTTTTATTTTAPRPPAAAADTFQWPWFGYDGGRTRDFPGPPDLHPPLHLGWHFFEGGTLEFSPVIDGEMLYLLDDNGSVKEVDLRNGVEVWHDHIGSLAAASPAVAPAAGVLIVPLLSVSGRTPGDGAVEALSLRTGRVVWSRPDSAGSESSPIVSGDSVYYGDQAGTLFARDVRDGRLEWAYHASGAIKGGPALVDGVLYFGDYAGRAYAVRASDGHPIWSVATSGAHFGFGSGSFYATPAVAYGRVYMGSTDGFVYSFGARTGALAWATATGSYVYASAAVADPAGLGPTVYVGSYDGYLYAFNAQSGAIRWRRYAGGKISGSATVVGDTVYYSDLAEKTSAGLDATTGRQVFSWPDGAFTAVIADDHAIYLDGYTTIYQLLPKP